MPNNAFEQVESVNALECADLSARCSAAICHDRCLNCALSRMRHHRSKRRQGAALQRGDQLIREVPVVQSNFKYFLFTQPRSDELGLSFWRPCSTTSTSHQLLLALIMRTRDPCSASPM